MSKEKEINNDEPFKNNTPCHYQIIVGAGETVRVLAKSSLASEYSPVGEDLTESTWIYADNLPYVDIKFEIPTNSKVYKVTA